MDERAGMTGRPVVLVTGGGSGIGAAVADKLGATHDVVICGRRLEALETVAARSGAHPMVADIADYARCETLISDIVARFGRLDGLVLNAGIVISASVADMALDDWEKQISVNLTAPFVMVKAALPHLIRTQGAIVSVSSVGAIQSGPGLAAYCSAKAGLSSLTQVVACEYARHGVRANVVAPGWIRTEMADEEMRALPVGDDLDVAYAKVSEFVPQRRAGTSMEAAEAIAFLLSPAASFINGAVLPVDGGSLLPNSGMIYFEQIGM